MKLQKNDSGYSHLVNENKQPVYCVERTPVQSIIPDKLNQPVAIEIPTTSSLCGDHCPFFEIDTPIGGVPVVVLNCRGGVNVGLTEFLEPSGPKKTKLQLS